MIRQVGVAFIGADDETARFSDGEVEPCDTGFGIHKAAAQVISRLTGQVVGIGGASRVWICL